MTPALSAVCPLHPEAPAPATCRRCGRFLCDACVARREPTLCAACAPLVTDPLGVVSSTFSVTRALGNGLKLVRPVAGKVLGVALAFSIPGGLLSWVLIPSGDASVRQQANNFRAGRLYDSLIGIVADIACLALFIGVAEGRRLSVSQALQEATSRWGRVFGARFRAGLITLLFALLLVVPGIWKSVLLSFTTIAAVRLRDEDALEASTRLVSGRWWPVLGFGVSAYAVVFIPVLVMAGVVGAVLPEFDGRPVFGALSEIWGDWVERVAEQLVSAMVLAAFYGLQNTTGATLEPMAWNSSVADEQA